MYNKTNIVIKKNKTDLILEMRKQMEELAEFLPYGYVKMVQAKLEKKVAPGTIHSVRSGQRNTIDVLAAILQVAKEEREKITNALEN